MAPAENSQGKARTWVNSRWKFRPNPGQFSIKLNNSWSFILYARNVTNSTQFIYHAPSLFFPQQAAYTVNPPFVLGGEVQYRF